MAALRNRKMGNVLITGITTAIVVSHIRKKRVLKDIYDDATKDKMGVLLLDLEGEPSKRFRSKFDEFYEIEQTM